MKAIALIMSLALGNFLFAWWFDASYQVAIERSYFQAVAVAVYVLYK